MQCMHLTLKTNPVPNIPQIQIEVLGGVPDNLLRTLRELGELFTVETDKLKEITDHFVKELEKGSILFPP